MIRLPFVLHSYFRLLAFLSLPLALALSSAAGPALAGRLQPQHGRPQAAGVADALHSNFSHRDDAAPRPSASDGPRGETSSDHRLMRRETTVVAPLSLRELPLEPSSTLASTRHVMAPTAGDTEEVRRWRSARQALPSDSRPAKASLSARSLPLLKKQTAPLRRGALAQDALPARQSGRTPLSSSSSSSSGKLLVALNNLSARITATENSYASLAASLAAVEEKVEEDGLMYSGAGTKKPATLPKSLKAAEYCIVGQWPMADEMGLEGDARYRCTGEDVEIVQQDEGPERRIPVNGRCNVQCATGTPSSKEVLCLNSDGTKGAKLKPEPECVASTHARGRLLALAGILAVVGLCTLMGLSKWWNNRATPAHSAAHSES